MSAGPVLNNWQHHQKNWNRIHLFWSGWARVNGGLSHPEQNKKVISNTQPTSFGRPSPGLPHRCIHETYHRLLFWTNNLTPSTSMTAPPAKKIEPLESTNSSKLTSGHNEYRLEQVIGLQLYRITVHVFYNWLFSNSACSHTKIKARHRSSSELQVHTRRQPEAGSMICKETTSVIVYVLTPRRLRAFFATLLKAPVPFFLQVQKNGT